ncbi:LysR family transcriptional regulator [Pelagibaculum spongiae]|uniref:LysR family transcriptional regulator n=1 Tax=Pelagibaculum spongiae TaxID=2080658 RepID=A0A2V1GVZ8_9GAMM|nr:LysR family transcriptional regulator [Pelagibaculum spongiae]PVZ70575.1 LysR family transcriptional regulator [Pelagibaculum spongiae]
MASSFGFDLKALETFVQVVKTGNMTFAARNLGMSQSSISQSLSNLETSMHVELLDRSVRPMELTTAGRYFFDRATTMLDTAKQTSQDMRKADYKLLRHVKMALVDSMITAVGKPLIDAVSQRTQNWSVMTGQSHLHAHMLNSRQVDMIISDDPLDSISDLARHRIIKEPFVLAVPNNYHGPQELHSVLQHYDLIRYSSGSLIGQDIERYLRRNQCEPVARLQLDNSFAIVSAVASGIGCCITSPLCLFQSSIKQQQVKLIPLKDSWYRNITLITRQNELGDLPGMIASDCRKILNYNFLSQITDEYRWLKSKIIISND